MVLVEDAGDAAAPALKAALDDWRDGRRDARRDGRRARRRASALRKAFEAARSAVAIGIYDDPPGRDEIEAALAAAGLARPDREAMGEIEALAQALDPGRLRAVRGEARALQARRPARRSSAADVAACAPPAGEAELDEVVVLAADGDGRAAGGAPSAGSAAARPALTIAAGRYFRTLHAAASAAEGAEAALARARPPVFGPRRARMAAQARALGPDRLEQALGLIIDTELMLRSSRPVPAAAVVERLLVRLAMLRRGA